MKKSIIVLMIVLTMGLGISGLSAFAEYYDGPHGGYGMRGEKRPACVQIDNKAYQKYLDETVELRKALAVDHAQLSAIMAGSDPNPKKVAQLTAKIFDNKEALGKIARSANIDLGPGCGYGAGGGYGFGRGYGARGYCDVPGHGGKGHRW